MKEIKRKLALVLAVCMVLNMVITANGEEVAVPEETAAQQEMLAKDVPVIESKEDEREASDPIEEDDIEEASPDKATYEEADTEDVTEASPSDSVRTWSTVVDGITITLTADPGVFPEDAELWVEKIEDEATEEAIEEAIEKERDNNANVALSVKFDIMMLVNGEEIQPDTSKGSVKVSFTLEEKISDCLDANAYHLKEDAKGELTAKNLNAKIKTEEAVSYGEAEEYSDAVDIDNDEKLEDGIVFNDVNSNEKGNSNADIGTKKNESIEEVIVIEADTDSFSYYVIEFTYNKLQYVLPGNTSIKLSEILKALAIEGTVSEAEVSNEEFLTVTIDAEGDDWTVTALQPFNTEEWMKVTIGGKVYEIVVTDEQSDCIHTDWTNWGDEESEWTSLPSSSGSYYLSHDATLSETWTVPAGSTNLCLNGHVIKANGTFGVIDIQAGATLNLYDCGSSKHYFTVDNDGLWHMDTGKSSGTPLEELTERPTSDDGIVIETTGGVITGGNVNNGGGVRISGGTFTMNAGNIIGNKTKDYGGGICIPEAGIFTMTGGVIAGNWAGQEGGGISANDNFNISGGVICNNYAHYNGGGIHTWTCEDSHISGNAVIKYNIASWGGGGGLHFGNNGDKVTLTGNAKIIGNSAFHEGGICNNAEALSLGGSVQINDNYGGGVHSGNKLTNQTLRNIKIIDKVITLCTGSDAPVTSGPNKMNVGVYTEGQGRITASSEASQRDCFSSDSDKYRVGYNSDGYLELVDASLYFITNNAPEANKEANHGFVEITPNYDYYAKNTPVTLKVTGSDGYWCKNGSLRVTSGDVSYPLTPVAGEYNTYTFTMQDRDVTVSAEFEDRHIHGTGEDEIEFNPWDSNNSLPNDPGNYILLDDVVIDSTWVVPDGEVNICLNGHVIKANTTDANKFRVIRVPGTAMLGIYDCRSNVEHMGDYSSLPAGGVITGGDNASGNGGGIYVEGSLSLFGGTITGNKAALGAGIYDNGIVTVGGRAKVTGNQNETAENNLYLVGGVLVTFGTGGNAPDVSDTGMKISITMQTPGKFATGGQAYEDCFSSDNDLYGVRYDETEKVLKLENSYVITNNTKEDDKDTNHGYLTIDRRRGAEDNKVTVTVVPGHGYGLKKGMLKAEYTGGACEMQPAGDDKYMFIMPADHVSVSAEFERVETHGEGCTIDFTATDTLPTDSGDHDIYLTADITLTETWNVPAGTTNLCLNGHVIKASSNFNVINVPGNATLNLYDCDTKAKHYFVVQSSGIWNLDETKHSGTAIESLSAIPAAGDVIEVTGGLITGGNAASGVGINWTGGGVRVSNGSFTMNGGSIIGNYAKEYGGGISIPNNGKGSFTMNAGMIAGNNALKQGGGISANANFLINKGSICFNHANEDGGGIHTWMCNDTKITGGVIKYNSANKKGGGIHIGNESDKMEVSGGTIIGNTAEKGGGLYIDNGTFTMISGSIRENTAASAGGVYYGEGKLTLGGSAKIIENVKSGEVIANNVYLPNDKTITLATEEFAPVYEGYNKMTVGVTMQKGKGKFTSSGTIEQRVCFTSDNSGYKAAYNKNGYLELIDADIYVIYNELPEAQKDTNHGYIIIENEYIKMGDTGRITLHPDSDYFLAKDSLKVTYGDSVSCDLTKVEDGIYTFIMPEADVTVTAVYYPKFKITFDANGHGTAPKAIEAFFGDPISEPSTPTETGYTFNGWYKEQACENKYSFGTMPAKNFTLYAKWTATAYTIIYKDKGGEVFSGIHESGYPLIHTYDTETLLKGASKAGYTFKGWFLNEECTGDALTVLGAKDYTADITLYAKWEANKYTVTFTGNYPDSTYIATISETYGLRYVLPSSDPTQSGYTFMGWYTAAAGGIRITTSAAVSISADHTIYAHWKKNSDPFPSGGGSSSVTITSIGWQEPVIGARAIRGEWTLAGNKWTFKSGGKSAINSWCNISYGTEEKPKNGWFFFDANGYMMTGWIKSVKGDWYYCREINDADVGRMETGWHIDMHDGKTYYLDPLTGKMAIGWTLINGKMYYFSEISYASPWRIDTDYHWTTISSAGRAIGSMYVNEITSDGHRVDTTGARIQ